jgi:hypothetical protein
MPKRPTYARHSSSSRLKVAAQRDTAHDEELAED